ncbi:MAG: endonuclease III [Planctomycetota bacterium]|jgi:endonuclease-3
MSRVAIDPHGTTKAGFDLPATTRAARDRARRIHDALVERHPDARCELDYRTPLELLIATILSAQATDVGVNKATPGLFKAFPRAEDYAAASPEQIEPHIRTIGLFRSKAVSIHAACSRIVSEYGGDVPDRMEDLLTLRGVARKTAGVVLGNAFGINMGVVVDTHVMRLSHRFGLSEATTPTAIERDLMALFARPRWTMISHLLIFHGRRVCKARGNTCGDDAVCRRFCSEAAETAG